MTTIKDNIMGRSEAIDFLEIIRLVQDERSKCLHIVLV